MKLCIDCGEEITPTSTRCSYCRGIASRNPNHCVDCGTEISHGAKRCHSCAYRHSRKHPEKRYSKYNKGFPEIARSIRERDGHACRICGNRKKWRSLPVHHINGDSLDDRPSNLITLCEACHKAAHCGKLVLSHA